MLPTNTTLNSNLKNYALLQNVSQTGEYPNNYAGSKFDISTLYTNYKNITMDNIFVMPKHLYTGNNVRSNISYSYDANTGIISVIPSNGKYYQQFSIADILILK